MLFDPSWCPEPRFAELLDWLWGLGDGGLALADFEAVAQSYPQDPRLKLILASLLATVGREEEALGLVGEAVRTFSAFHAARFRDGLIELSQGRKDEAEACWAPLMVMSEGSPLRLFATGLLHLVAEQLDAAQAYLREGLLVEPPSTSLHSDMQRLLDWMSDHELSRGAPTAWVHRLLTNGMTRQ